MAVTYSWTPKNVKPSAPRQVQVTLWDGTPVDLASVVSVGSDGTVTISVPSTNRYRILVTSALGMEAIYPTISEPAQSDKPVRSVVVSDGFEDRPDASTVLWIGGSSKPANMIDGDLWFLSSTVADTSAPTTPASISILNLTDTSFKVSWQSSSDNVGVTAYEVQVDGVSKATTSSTSATVTGFTANTSYSVTVRSRDAAGNWSEFSSPLSVTTLSSAPVTSAQHSIYGDTPHEGTLVAANDGQGIKVGTGFAVTGVTGWRLLGVRLYIPSNVTVGNEATFYYWSGVDQFEFTGPDQSGVVTGLTTGWNEYLFSSPVVLTADVDFYVGYSFTSNDYLSTPSPGAGVTYASDTNSLYRMAETQRSLFLYANGVFNSTSGLWGIDVIVDEGIA